MENRSFYLHKSDSIQSDKQSLPGDNWKTFLKGKKVTVMGLGLFGGGTGITSWLYKAGARVTVTDLRKPAELKESLQALAELKGIKYRLGRHLPDDFAKADLIIVNPAVPEGSPYLQIARKHDVPLETENNIFFQVCSCPIIGVTGSNGKTTTAALIYEMLKGTNRKVWLGGNIGMQSLHEVSDRIRPNDLAVLELSSFQLESLGVIRKSPFVSVVTNISPNHLDRHKTMVNYINAKKNILKFQTGSDYTVLNLNDKEVSRWSRECRSNILFFVNSKPGRRVNGAYIDKGRFYIVKNDNHRYICDSLETKLLGGFNLENIAAALAVASIFDVPGSFLKKTINSFKGIEHRLEFVKEIKGVKYYNDSIATNPESTIGAIRAVKGGLNLILGGYDKKLPFDGLAKEIAGNNKRIKSIILLGQTADTVQKTLKSNKTAILKVKTFRDAVLLSGRIAQQGETVLFSPACASFDMFRNFRERGEVFKKIVLSLDK